MRYCIARARITSLLSVVCLLVCSSTQAQPVPVQLLNPNWNITLTDAGYSDWLYDNTPGFEGREYLSGEWAAAIAYVRGTGPGATVVTPTWLEPQFLYPDWVTNSTFTTVSGHAITVTGQAFGGLDAMAASRIANADLQIDLAFEMLDTLTGMKMGTAPASAATGGFKESNRYVFKQTLTITNISGSLIHGLSLFQFLHALNGDTSLYDNRNYAGPLGEYQYDTTQVAVDTTFGGTGGTTFRDYISFASRQTPAAFDNGRYGIEGVDSHVTGKPGVGVHLSIESDTLAGLDFFAPTNPVFWIGGAQKYILPDLAPGASTSFDIVLSVRTGTVVDNTGTCSGSANGGSHVPGGVDFSFENVTLVGDFFAEYEACDAAEVAARIAAGEFPSPTFPYAGPLQLYELEYDGDYTGNVTLVFGYDPLLLPPTLDETTLVMYHLRGNAWQSEGGVVDPLAHTITITTDVLGIFALGVASEPGSRTILQWRSVRVHTGIGPVGIVLDPDATGNGATGPTVEPRGPRTNECGIQRIEVEFDGPITRHDDAGVLVVGQTTTAGVLGPPVEYAPDSVTVSGANTLVIVFDPGNLPDHTCYTFTLAPATLQQTIVGDNDCLVRSLFGDTTGSGEVNLSDAMLSHMMVGQPAQAHPEMDSDLSGGMIAPRECQLVKHEIASPPHSALCP